MWPLLITSIISFSVAIERFIFILKYRSTISQNHQQRFSDLLASNKIDEALGMSEVSTDPLIKVACYSNLSSLSAFQISYQRSCSSFLSLLKRGSGVLDTSITIAPLLGLLGTVTGLIQSFYSLGNAELSSPLAITGGISEALIATGFGLGVAIICLIPFNMLITTEERSRETLEELGSMLEVALGQSSRIN